MKFCYKQVLPFLNNPKDVDPSYKMDLDFWDCFGSNKICLITEEIRYIPWDKCKVYDIQVSHYLTTLQYHKQNIDKIL